MSQVKVGKQVNEVEGHERKAEDDADPFLTSFAWRETKKITKKKDPRYPD